MPTGEERTGRRARAARKKGKAAQVGTKKLRAEEREKREAAEGAARPGPRPALEVAGPLTVGRRSSAMRDGTDKSVSPAQGGTRTGNREH